MREINGLKQQLENELEVKDLGATNHTLRMTITQSRSKGILKFSQEKYIEKVFDRFRAQNAKSRSTPLGSQIKL